MKRELLRVNMSDLSISREPLPEGWRRYGGRALTDAIVFTEVPGDADPLGPDNVLVFAPGILGGTSAPNGGRLSVGAKSPLTGGIKESNSGGQAAHALGRIGIAAVIVTGKPADASARYMLVIEADGSASMSASTSGRGSATTSWPTRSQRPVPRAIATPPSQNGPAERRGRRPPASRSPIRRAIRTASRDGAASALSWAARA
jgi:hypothetical protein